MTGSPIEFDQRGDLKLRVGPPDDATSNSFLVCSRALARISPVFDRMLYGSFAEAKPANSKDWVVDLIADDPAALVILLRIAHCRFQEVPETLTIDGLYALTTLTHYYDATPALSPWIDSWLASVEDIWRDSNVIMPKLLWVAWELGRKIPFGNAARRILTEAPASLLEPFSASQDLQMPPDIMDEGPRWCRHASYMGPHRCESMILGSMTFCLARAGFWPLPDAADVEESIVDLYAKLMNLVIHDIGRPTPKSAEDHSECNPAEYLTEQIKRIIDGIADPVTPAHWRHLEIQARKLSP
ncbi:hypothetical protein DL768_010870 [Monosporascus sp. mg162]|nr:hypothetical protein DL768_010870 [Monosporascus sp. mg162]